MDMWDMRIYLIIWIKMINVFFRNKTDYLAPKSYICLVGLKTFIIEGEIL
jgi:hypothetical protein